MLAIVFRTRQHVSGLVFHAGAVEYVEIRFRQCQIPLRLFSSITGHRRDPLERVMFSSSPEAGSLQIRMQEQYSPCNYQKLLIRSGLLLLFTV